MPDQLTWIITLRQGCQVGIFKAKYHKFGLFWSCFGMKKWCLTCTSYFGIFGLFWWCWHEKPLFGIFQKLWLSYFCRLGITELFPRTKFLSFPPRSHSRRYKRLCRLSDVTGQKTQYLFGHDFENCGGFKQSRLGGFRKINIKVYANQVGCCAVQYLSFF